MPQDNTAADKTPAPTIVLNGKTLPASEGFRPTITFQSASGSVGGVREAIQACHELSRLVQKISAAENGPNYTGITRSVATQQPE